MRIVARRTGIVGLLLSLCIIAGHKGYAQADGDLIGFKGGYKALSRLCEQNLDGAARLLVNDYSRGYFVSLSIAPGSDTIADISFLTATPADMAAQIAWALRGTNGQWIKRDRPRKLLVPIFFCQNTPPNDSLFSQLLVTNNVGFSVPNFPDQWPEAAEGVWIHPICPLVAGGTPRAPVTPAAKPPVAAASTPAVVNPPVMTQTTAAGTTTAPATGAASWPPDTLSISGVFRTKDDFDKGVISFGNTYPVEERGLLSWFTIDYAAYGTVRVRTSPGKDYQEFPLGTITGFKNSNIWYVYLKANKEYLAVLNRSSAPFYLLMDERKQTGYNGNPNLDGIFLYAHSLDGPFKEFTRHNIDAEFSANPQMVSDLQILRKELNKHAVSMTRGDFEACRELTKDYLSKWATAH
jgi:hypothetical protein